MIPLHSSGVLFFQQRTSLTSGSKHKHSAGSCKSKLAPFCGGIVLGELMGAALIAGVPVAIAYNLFLDRFITGITGGAVKG
jgi:ABC-type glycerol-3-phosphate transport system permease component